MTPPPISQFTLAKQAGFPEALLVPVCPLGVPLDRFPDRGKCPAIWGKYGWTNHKEWQHGTTLEDMEEADARGCNIGLRLGVPHEDRQFVFIDIDTAGDTDPDSPASQLARWIQREALKSLALYVDASRMWVRLTRPGRAGVLLELPGSATAGRVSTVHLTAPSGVSAGMLQILATGQQAVIGGTHPWNAGTPIRWLLISNPPEKDPYKPYPLVDDDCIPKVEDRHEVNSAIDHVLITIQETCKVNFAYKKHQSSSTVSGKALTLIEQAPWDAKSFINLFKKMPHNDQVDRDMWVDTMMAAQGCIQSSIMANETDLRLMTNAAIEWSAKWEDPHGLGTTVIDETEVWEKDWGTRDVKHLGWRHLIEQAVFLGNTSLRYESACHDFTADLAIDVSNKPHVILPSAEVRSVQTRRRETKVKFDVKTSEIQITDAIQDVIGRKCAYVADEKRWIAWGGPNCGWSEPRADAIVKQEIENQLVYYVERHSESFGDSESIRAKLTSARSVRDIENMLRSRLTITPNEINLGELILQTPEGPWDLVTGAPLVGDRYDNLINLRDTRLTGYYPIEGPTPLFDSLVDHLACGEIGVKEWLLGYFGYALLGKPLLHNILILYGPGGNGKTTLANIMMKLMGYYSTPLDRKVIVQSGSNDHPTGLKMIKNRRLWCVPELSPKENWNEAIVRTISGGDPITARGMNENFTSFQSEGTLFIYTNFIPAFHRIDEAIVRRFRIIHGRIKVPMEMMDVQFEARILQQEGSAILFKLIQEGKRVIDRGWKLPETPPAIQRDTKRYFANQDAFQMWFSDECLPVRADSGFAPVAIDVLYERYKAHATRNIELNTPQEGEDPTIALMETGFQCLTAGAFAAALQRVGAVDTDNSGLSFKATTGRRMVRGIRLKVLAEVAAA